MTSAANMDYLGDDLPSDHEMRNADELADGAEFGIADGLGLNDSDDKRAAAQSSFFELANHRLDDDMWEEEPEAPLAAVHAVLSQPSPWESGGSDAAGGEGWAQFDAFCFPSPAPASGPAPPAPPPPAAQDFQPPFAPFWPYESDAPPEPSGAALEEGMRRVRLGGDKLGDAGTAELANNLLTAMSAMSPDAIANIVNANLQPLPLPPATPPRASPPRAASPAAAPPGDGSEAAAPEEDAPIPADADPPRASAGSPADDLRGDARSRRDPSPTDSKLPEVGPREDATPAAAGPPEADAAEPPPNGAAAGRPSYASVVNKNERARVDRLALGDDTVPSPSSSGGDDTNANELSPDSTGACPGAGPAGPAGASERDGAAGPAGASERAAAAEPAVEATER